jgi:ketopantoate reductase
VLSGSIALSSHTDCKIIGRLREVLEHSIPITVVTNPTDVAHCKLVMNLGNALLAMVAYHEHRDIELPELQELIANMMWEGVLVLKKNGINEVKVPGLPSWVLIKLSVKLPGFVVVPIFRKKMKNSSINSMAQDLSNGSEQTELEDLNGYLIELAEKHSMKIPYNKGVYQLFKKWNRKGAQPLTPSVVLNEVKSLSSL